MKITSILLSGVATVFAGYFAYSQIVGNSDSTPTYEPYEPVQTPSTPTVPPTEVSASTNSPISMSPPQTAPLQNSSENNMPEASGSEMDRNPIKRCMTLTAMMAPNEGDWVPKIRRKDIMLLATTGFDTIRLPVRVSGHTDINPPYKINPALLTRVDEVMNWVSAAGMNVILDIHLYEEINVDPDIHEPRLEAMWDQLARRYASAPDNVFFELLNEPHDAMTIKRMDKLNQRLVSRIRMDNPDRWLVVGSAQWGTLWGLIESKPPKDSKLINTFHYYEPFNFTHQGATWTTPPLPDGVEWGTFEQREQNLSELTLVKEWAKKHGNNPILLGEFGVAEDGSTFQRAKWTRHIRQTAEQLDMGWCYWGWSGGFGLYDMERNRWVKPLKDALISDVIE